MTMDFDEYMQQGEPGRQERAYAWRTAIGLQAVDGLTPSDYLKDTARRLHIHPAPEWREQPRLDDGTSAVQARCKYGTSTMQVEAATPSPYVLKLIMVLGKEQMPVKVLMERLQLRGRANFMNLYLVPAIQAGFVTLLYPDTPRHPRQEYMLSGKGRAVYEEMQR